MALLVRGEVDSLGDRGARDPGLGVRWFDRRPGHNQRDSQHNYNRGNDNCTANDRCSDYCDSIHDDGTNDHDDRTNDHDHHDGANNNDHRTSGGNH